jgi:hypothetical protein
LSIFDPFVRTNLLTILLTIHPLAAVGTLLRPFADDELTIVSNLLNHLGLEAWVGCGVKVGIVRSPDSGKLQVTD